MPDVLYFQNNIKVTVYGTTFVWFKGIVGLTLTPIDYVEQHSINISDDTDTDDSSEEEELDEDDDPHEGKKTIKYI